MMTDKLPKLTPENFINRELSTVEFNKRVLALAQNPSIPLLERIKFLAIVGNNIDEFFMVRVAPYIQKSELGISNTRPDGYTATQLIIEIRKAIIELINSQRKSMKKMLKELSKHDIHITEFAELKPNEQEAVRQYFHDEVFPVLTPLAADHARPFPFISNLSLNIGVYLSRNEHHSDDDLDFVRIKVPDSLPRLLNVNDILKAYKGKPADTIQIVWLEDVISENLDLLFSGMTVIETFPFRVTRNADIDYEHEQDEEMLDLSAVIEANVRERRFGSVVRLAVPDTISPFMKKRLINELQVKEERDVYSISGSMGSSSLFELMKLDRPDLKYPPHVPKFPESLPQDMNIFAMIRQQDILLHHPYDSFTPVEDFFWAAAHDPQVLAIKATLYRVGKNAPVVQALMEARENNKQVAVLVELKARFDEENNLVWARALEDKGVHVTYGVEKLPVKTHSKIVLVIRKEDDGLRRYVHLGTGNYNAATARLYSDMGLFTSNPEIGEDATRLFNRLTGFAPHTTYNRLLVAPEYFQKELFKLIDNEIEYARAGKPARLVFKMNQVEEEVTIQKLYQASQAGVQIDLIVRGICCLKPGIPGISENIRVKSILGRFLEHPRIYYFHNSPPDQRIYAGSADLMKRNIYNRVETVFPVLSPRLQQKLVRILATDLYANVNAWELRSDGNYHKIEPKNGDKLIDSQYIFTQNSAGLELDLP